MVIGPLALYTGCGGDDGDSTDTERALQKLERATGASPEAPVKAKPAAGAPQAKADASALIRRYFSLIDADEFVQAWALLDPSVQEGFGGYEAWRDGYASNVATEVLGVSVNGDSDSGVSATVRISAVDECDGERYQQEFEGPWSVDQEVGRITGADFSLVSGSPPPSSCLG